MASSHCRDNSTQRVHSESSQSRRTIPGRFVSRANDSAIPSHISGPYELRINLCTCIGERQVLQNLYIRTLVLVNPSVLSVVKLTLLSPLARLFRTQCLSTYNASLRFLRLCANRYIRSLMAASVRRSWTSKTARSWA